ncbi:MAG TPA: NACHT domain-containing protein [Streptosporangiaceae bacterium]|jgi:hypothetical protein
MRTITAGAGGTSFAGSPENWFAGELDAGELDAGELDDAEGVLRVGVLHHNARRKATADNENLRDEDDLTSILGGHLDLLLHGHTHAGKEDRLADGTLVLATGSTAVTEQWRPAEVPNQYQVLRIQPGRLTRWARRWDGQGDWIADTRASRSGNHAVARVRLDTPGWAGRPGPRGEADLRAEAASAQLITRRGADLVKQVISRRQSDFVEQVATVTRLDLAAAGSTDRIVVEARSQDELDYVLAFRSGAQLRCVGVVDGQASRRIIGELDARVFDPLRSRGAAELMVVHHGPDDPALRDWAGESAVRVKTWTEYNQLLEIGPYRDWLHNQLAADPLYPQPLYQPQRYREVDRFGVSQPEDQADLLETVYQSLLRESGQLALVLGEAGYGKSFLVRRLAWRLLENERAGLTPIVVYLRDRDKRQSVDEMVSAALVPSRAAFQPDRFQHSLEAGTLVLLIDGYDEFAVRVGYANAAAQLATFTSALQGRAKIVLTTRPSHFVSTDAVTSKLFENLRTVHDGQVYRLEPFDEDQQRAFLTRWFELTNWVDELAGRKDPPTLADAWMQALAKVDNLPELARTPRMLSFMVEDLSLAEIEQAAGKGTVTAAQLYQKLVDRWLSAETSKIDPAAPGTISPGQRQDLLEELALRLWSGRRARRHQGRLGTDRGRRAEPSGAGTDPGPGGPGVRRPDAAPGGLPALEIRPSVRLGIPAGEEAGGADRDRPARWSGRAGGTHRADHPVLARHRPGQRGGLGTAAG